MFVMVIGGIAVITVIGADYYCVIHGTSKSEAIHLLDNFALDDHGYIYKI